MKPLILRACLLRLLLPLLVSGLPATVHGAPFIDMGPAPLLGAYDQPMVQFEIHDGQTSFGPSSASRTFLLDTGATSILAVGSAAGDLRRSSGDFTQGEFLEQGVGGFTPYQVSAPYTITVTSNNGHTMQRDAVQILNDPGQTFGALVDFEGIVGMPAMVDRVTTLDMSSGDVFGGLGSIDLTDLDQLIDGLSGTLSGIGVSFSDRLPPSNGHRYGIPARALHFEPDVPGPSPTTAPLALVTATHRLDGKSVTGDHYIIDTGAQLSFISLDKARDLGLDPKDPFFFQPISGVGGVKNTPVFYIEELSLTSQDGVELIWKDAQVIGLDLDPRIDGVIGSDLLTAGLIETDFEAFDLDNLITVGEGPIQQVHFDFRQLQQPDGTGTGVMYLDLNPDVDVINQGLSPLQAGDANQDRSFDQLDIVQVMQRARYLTGRPATWGDGDWNGAPGGTAGEPPPGDGVFDQRDIVAALSGGFYRAGPYATTQPAGPADTAPVFPPDQASVLEAMPGGGLGSLGPVQAIPAVRDPLFLPADSALGRLLATSGEEGGPSAGFTIVPEPSPLPLALMAIALFFLLMPRQGRCSSRPTS